MESALVGVQGVSVSDLLGCYGTGLESLVVIASFCVSILLSKSVNRLVFLLIHHFVES